MISMFGLEPDVAIKMLIRALLTIKLKPIAEKIQREQNKPVVVQIQREGGIEEQRRLFDVPPITGKHHFMISFFLYLLNRDWRYLFSGMHEASSLYCKHCHRCNISGSWSHYWPGSTSR